MRKLLFFFMLQFPNLIFCQTEVILKVSQPPEFGFSISKQDTTIFRGSSIELGNDLVLFGGSGEYIYQWSPDATLNDATLLHPIANPTDTTTYLLTVIDASGCSFNLAYKVNVKGYPVSVDDQLGIDENLNAILFPNPNDGQFKVKLTGKPCEKIDLILIDNLGRMIHSKTIRNFTGDHTELFKIKITDGAYSIIIETGQISIQRQFIIH